MDTVKLLLSLFLGIILGYLFFAKNDKKIESSNSSNMEVNSSMMGEELANLKKDLSSCEKREQVANDEVLKLKENLAHQDSNKNGKTPAAELTSTKIQEKFSDEKDLDPKERTADVLHTNQTSESQPSKKQFLKSAKWIEAEQELDSLPKDDSNSRSAFLNRVTIPDLEQVLSFTTRVDSQTQSFVALSGTFSGVMKDLTLPGKEYQLVLELNYPNIAQGDANGQYTVNVHGEGLNSSSQGKGLAKDFSSMTKDMGSRVLFFKLNSESYLQLYPEGSRGVIGNAYRKIGKSFVKFGEFELTKH